MRDIRACAFWARSMLSMSEWAACLSSIACGAPNNTHLEDTSIQAPARSKQDGGVDSGAAQPDSGDAASSVPIDAGGEMSTDTLADITQRCEQAGRNADLTPLPEALIVFRHATAQCEPVATELLLRNTSKSPVTISELHVSAGPFAAKAVQPLPQELPPNAGALILVTLTRDAKPFDKEIPGTLTVMTSQGCARLSVTGVTSVEWPVINQSAQAIDFGEVVVGEQSAPHQLTIQLQQSGLGADQFLGFASDSAEFTILPPQPPRESLLKSCDTLSLSLRFKAPSVPGRVKGYLFWERYSSEASGISMLPLFGSAVARP